MILPHFRYLRFNPPSRFFSNLDHLHLITYTVILEKKKIFVIFSTLDSTSNHMIHYMHMISQFSYSILSQQFQAFSCEAQNVVCLLSPVNFFTFKMRWRHHKFSLTRPRQKNRGIFMIFFLIYQKDNFREQNSSLVQWF